MKRKIQDLVPPLATCKYSPPPSLYMPAGSALATIAALNLLMTLAISDLKKMGLEVAILSC